MLKPKAIEFIKKLTEKSNLEKVIMFGAQALVDSDKNSNRRKLMV